MNEVNEMECQKEGRLVIPIHYLMAFCGGFFGMYAVIGRMGNLGQAQTGNLIELVCCLIGRNFEEVGLRFLAMILFVGGIVLATVLEKTREWNLKYLAVILDAAAAVVIGFFPEKMDPVAALYPVFFATAFQWCVFKGAKGYVSATVFSSNNLKQTTVAAVEYFLSPKEEALRAEKKERAFFFGGTILSFHCGVAAGYFLWTKFDYHSIWFNVIPLFLCLLLVIADDRDGIFVNGR